MANVELEGRVFDRKAVEQVFKRLQLAFDEPCGSNAVDSLRHLVLGNEKEITHEGEIAVLNKHELLLGLSSSSASIDDVDGGKDGLVAAVVRASVYFERGEVRVRHPLTLG